MHESWALLKKNMMMTLNLGRTVRAQSRFKTAFITLFTVFLLGGLWGVFLRSLIFLDKLGGVGLLITHRLFNMFFFGMGIMLVISGLVTSYTTLFRSHELPFLFQHPISRARVAVHRVVDAAGISSWAFFFIAIPFIGAFAQHEKLSPLFLFWSAVFSVPFVLLCTGLGSVLLMVFVRYVPRMRNVLILLALFALALLVRYVSGLHAVSKEQDETVFIVTRILPGMRMATNIFLPSSWVAKGVESLTHGAWGRGFMIFNLILSHPLLLFLLVAFLGKTIFFDAWQKTLSSSQTKRKRILSGLEKYLQRLPGDVRGIILKDFRIFLRDPAQWVQGLVFFGLLGFYFFNIRIFKYHLLPPVWKNLIAFLNLFSLSAVMCSFSSRFVYPQLSLEGHGFWLSGLSP